MNDMNANEKAGPVSLNAWRKEGASLDDAMQAAGQDAVALLYSPDRCRLLWKKDVDSSNLDGVYEARIFDEDAEVRWLNSENFAVRLSEKDWKQEEEGEWLKVCVDDSLHLQNVVDSEDRSYVLWGKANDRPGGKCEGYTYLAEYRTGGLDVPYKAPVENKGRLVMKAREYLAVDDQYGNVAVVAERLCGIEALTIESR